MKSPCSGCVPRRDERNDLVIRLKAKKEAEEIRTYQAALAPKRGQQFVDAWETCLSDPRTKPLYQKHTGAYRHVMLKRLRHRAVFEVDGTTVVVFQVRHTSRKASKSFGP
ncbi:MAG: type II toxin-antitoxin system RelE/ParE family toxin [Flavobacteriales bacterium]|nr:type II toxin-antitoxin system RelE/ParE family toxin [Flavobacteriales bacterium]